ncbi:MAG: hypothetical protein R3266_08005 [Gemmatimonadota bacterium]|nr:hypothetical protein [Gemmatimonadota bacterium]
MTLRRWLILGAALVILAAVAFLVGLELTDDPSIPARFSGP